MASFLDVCRFTAASNGTGSFVVSGSVTGYQTPASANAVNGATYRYRAESADQTQWEVGYGVYTVSTTTLTRSTVLFNSSGGTSAINFTFAPQVATVALAEDLPILRGYLSGAILSTAGSSSTFGVSAGMAADATNSDYLSLSSAYTKTTGSWAVGSGNGSLDTGTIANSTWYHVHLIKRMDTGIVDVLISLSAASPTLPTNYTLFRRIGAMTTFSSPQWRLFSQLGDEFLWPDSAKVPDIATTTLGTTPTNFTLQVPTGVKVIARVRGYTDNGAIIVGSPDEALATGANVIVGNLTGQAGSAGVPAGLFTADIRTNTSAQITATAASSSTGMHAVAYGWIDRRGRDA